MLLIGSQVVYSNFYYYLVKGRIQLWEFLMLPLFILLVFFITRSKQRKNIDLFPEYKYFVNAIVFKIIGVIGFCLIYSYYYDGGDTFAYHNNSCSLASLAIEHPLNFFSIMLGNMSSDNFSLFRQYESFYAFYYWKDAQAFFVNKLVTPFVLIGFKGYLLTSVIIAYVTFSGVWKLYQVFIDHFPNMKKELAIAILFMPSVAFWGSGILKDSWTLAATGWLTYSFYNLAIKFSKKTFFYFIITTFISGYILFSLKPYILYSLMFGYLIWLVFSRLKSIKSAFHRVLIFPSIFLLSWLVGGVILSNTGKIIGGDYENIDKMINRADVIRRDLIRSEQYGSNNFNIGNYDKNNFFSILMKVPMAMVAGLFRPFLWEVRNIVMLLSGLENLFIMIFIILVVFRRGPMFLLNTLFDHPLILFSFVFAMTFAFSIGFSTSNFGALVRYKIPLIPFLMAALFFVRKKQINVAIEDEKRKQLYVPQSGLKV